MIVNLLEGNEKEEIGVFDDIGGKIQKLAIGVCCAGCAVSCVLAMILWAGNSRYQSTILLGFCTLGVGAVASLIGAFTLYGFGELIDMVQEIKMHLERQNENRSYSWMQSGNAVVTGQVNTTNTFKKECPYCGAKNNLGNKTCFACDKEI